MSVMDIFRSILPSAPAGPAAPINPAVAGNPAMSAPGNTAPSGPLPGSTANPTVPVTPEVLAGPLDKLAEIWTPGKDVKEIPNPGDMFNNIDPAKIAEAAGKIDFTSVASAEQLQKIQAGGSDAMATMMQVMNQVAQSAYARSAVATTKIVQSALTQAAESNDARLPSLIKKHSVNEGLLSNNPLMANPAVAPLVQALQETLVRKNPGATAQEIQEQINGYFAGLSTAFAPVAPVTAASKKAKQGEDWSAFFTE